MHRPLAALISIVLGMGMPTLGVYLLLATLVVPSMVEVGIRQMAAHLFALYFGMLSMITPPVAIAAFAAATVADSDPIKTATAAVMFGWSAYVVPFLFPLSPELMMQGSALAVAHRTSGGRPRGRFLGRVVSMCGRGWPIGGSDGGFARVRIESVFLVVRRVEARIDIGDDPAYRHATRVIQSVAMSYRPVTHTLVVHRFALLLGKSRGEIIMNITDFVDHLKRRKGDILKTDRDIANYLSTTPAQMSKWLKANKTLTNLEMEGLIERTRKTATDEALSVAIAPIVEFFPIERVESKQGMKWELFATSKDAPLPARGLRKELEKAKGIYIFYDTRGRALYAGKTTRRTLWAEMKNAFNRDRGRQELFRVEHPTRNQEFILAADKPRLIKQTSVLLADMASYFSAYEISPGMIDSIEALVIRAFANDLLNARMERF